MNPVISWFEIPTADFERGIRFYETVLGVSLKREDMGPMHMALFPYEEGAAAGGAVIHMEGGQAPGPTGCVVYLFGGDDLSAPLARVEAAGGVITVPKTAIPGEMGYFAVFRDTEGNHVGLYSQH
ncbi:MAG: VOC family protein [Betaproteobacteria bacterium]|nr:VOC family protein [Betaproteobacteria bacterium]